MVIQPTEDKPTQKKSKYAASQSLIRGQGHQQTISDIRQFYKTGQDTTNQNSSSTGVGTAKAGKREKGSLEGKN